MNDEPDPGDTDAHIRAMLADAGSGTQPEPVPAEVAARLDRTLAELVAERGSHQDNVVPLRRPWAARLAVAAAAVVVLGAGGVAATGLGLFESNRQADSTADSTAGSSADSSAGSAGAGSDTSEPATVPDLGSASFAGDVAALLERRPALLERQDARQESGDSASARCPGPAVTDGVTLRSIRLDGQQAVLLVHPRRADRQLVEAWSCDGEARLAATTVTR